jgi:hypothetical protein
MRFLLLVITCTFYLNATLFALTVDEVKKKAEKKGGHSLSFRECKLVGSKFSNIDANGNKHTDGGFHCNYVSDSFNKKETGSIIDKYKNHKGSLKDLCGEIERHYNNGNAWANSFNEETLDCDTKSDIGQKEYDTMKPILKKQHYEVLKQREIGYQKKLIAEKKADEENKAEIEARKGNTYPIEFGKDYKCEPYRGYLGIKVPVIISVGRRSMTLTSSLMGIGSSVNFNFIESYDEYHLFRGLDEKYNIVRAKVFNKKGINGGNVNFESGGIEYYCTKR